MHARHRAPSNGYRPNPVGIGGAPAYRNYNNRAGFGRGNQKPFQSGTPPPPAPLPPPASRRSGDVFMEAGKLATEYLISKGLLPANVLNGKWRNGGDYVTGAVSGRFSDDYSFPEGTRDGMRGRRRLGSFKSPEFDRNLETDRTGLSSAKAMSSSDKQGEDDSFSGSIEKLQYDEDNRDLESKSSEKNENQNELPDDNEGLKALSSDISPDESKNLKIDTQEMIMDDSNNCESEKSTVKEDTSMENQDLLTFIRLHKVPTRTRSSITIKGPKINPVLTPNDEKITETDNPVGDVVSEKEQESNPESDEVAEPDREHEHDEHVEHRGEKRPLSPINGGQEAKKPKDGSPSNVQEDDPCNDYAEKNQLFPDSFKICELNLMEASNGNDNHDTNGRKGDEKEVEVIDLDGDSVHDNKAFDNSERMDETIFTDLESFPDSMQRVNEMPQDGYGLMISELLDADIPNCSDSGVNPIHDRIGLENDEGILDDDESIYMSLGEIPISFVPVWDQQPTRGYDKPY